MAKKLLSVFLVFILAVTMVTGCGRKASSEDNDEPEKSASGIVDLDEKAHGKDTGKVNQSVPPAFAVFLPSVATHGTTEEEAKYFAEQVKAAYPDNSQIGEIKQTTIDGLSAHRVDVVYPMYGDMKKEI